MKNPKSKEKAPQSMQDLAGSIIGLCYDTKDITIEEVIMTLNAVLDLFEKQRLETEE